MLSFILSFILIWVVEKFTRIFAWTAIFGTFFLIMTVSTWCFILSYRYKSPDNNRITLKVFGAIGWAIGLIYAAIVYCFMKQLKMALAILEAAADFVTDTLRILIVPVVSFCGIICWITLWVVVAIFIYSVGDIKAGTGGRYKKVDWEPTTRYFWYYNFVALFWVSALIIAVAQFIIIVSVCFWYFSHGDDTKGKANVTRSVKWTFKYHFGSLALGSAILAIVWMIRLIFEYM